MSPQKRAIDVLVGSLFVWSGPLSGVYAAPAIMRNDRMNPLFRQTRYGGFGWNQPFHLLKWRSMPPDTPETESLEGSHDARATPTGETLRKTKLDELFQFGNVIAGSISLVGPYRPQIAGGREHTIMAADEQDRPAVRQAVAVTKPGLTSRLSLQRERHRTSYEPAEVAQAVLEYKDTASFKLDNEVFKQTIGLGLTNVIRLAAAARWRNQTVAIPVPLTEEVVKFDFSQDTQLAAKLGTLATNLSDEIT